MYSINGQTITLTRGDSFYATITIKKKSDNTTYTPVEGDSIKFYLKKDMSKLNKNAYVYESPVLTKEIPINTLILHLDSADTSSLIINDYVYDIELTYANGDVDTFINNAPFVLVQ